MRRQLAAFKGAAGALHVALGLVLLLVGARALLDLGAPPRLDPTGAWLDDGWARAARGALLVVTGLATLGLVRVPAGRRLAALALLLVSALGLGIAAGALDLVVLWGEGSAPLAGWLAIVWPWAGWTVVVRLTTGLVPALEEWSLDATAARTAVRASGPASA